MNTNTRLNRLFAAGVRGRSVRRIGPPVPPRQLRVVPLRAFFAVGRMTVVKVAVMASFVLFCAHSQAFDSVGATLTADNHYGLYYGQADGTGLTFVGRNEFGDLGDPGDFTWTAPETWMFDAGQGDHLYVVAWDDDVRQMWAGDFQVPFGLLGSNLTDWQYFISSNDNPGRFGDVPPLATVAAEISTAVWANPTASAPSGHIWGGIPGISLGDFVWHDTLDVESSSDLNYVIFRTVNPVIQIGGACCFDTSCLVVETEADCIALGGVWLGAGTDCVNNPCGIEPLHVDSIVVSGQNVGGGNRKGRAEVTILDAFGNAVEGALVRGTFSGDYNEISSGVTDIDGVANMLTANTVKGSPQFVFCVDTVTDVELFYDPAGNVETCDFIGDGPPTGACCVESSCSIETEADCSALGGSWLGAGTECASNPCGGAPTQMHVGAIDLSTQSVGGGNKKGRADVTILDEFGNVVPGVTVIGTFVGDYMETASAITGGDGVATLLTTGTVHGKPHFMFCVDDVVDAALFYDSAANVETCDSQ